MSDRQAHEELISARRHSDEPFYLLVDPLESVDEDSPLSLEALQSTLGREHVAVVPRPDLMHTPPDCPHLVLLMPPGEEVENGSAAQRLLALSVEYARNEHPAERRYICGWLQSRMGIEALAQELAGRMALPKRAQGIPVAQEQAQAQVQADRSNTRIHPVYEPLRQELMAYESSATAPGAHAQWLGGITRWMIPASHQGFVCFEAQVPESKERAQLPQQMIHAQTDAPLVADVLRVWKRLTTQPLDPQRLHQMPLLTRGQYALPQGAAYAALKQVRSAYSQGLKDRHDQIMFAIARLTMHPMIDRHPLMRAAILNAAQGKATLTGQLGHLKHTQIMQMLHEINA